MSHRGYALQLDERDLNRFGGRDGTRTRDLYRVMVAL